MSKADKLLDRAINNPQGLSFSELETLVKNHGFQFDRQNGSHRIYVNKALNVTLNLQPDKNGKAKFYQVKEFLQAIGKWC